jgi:lipoate-protein ligase B
LAKPSTSSIADVAPAPVEVLDWGRIDYRDAHARQLELLEARQRDECPDTLVVLEHDHVFTLGRRKDAQENVLAPGDVPVIEVERGGDVTYHGPGQIVAYPIFLLREHERDLHRFLRLLEDATIATVAAFGIDDAGREPDKTGVWRRGKKLASIGIACRRWVTFHGLALNVSTDLSYFHRIQPCGFQASVMTSIDVETGRANEMTAVKDRLAVEILSAFARAC